MNCDSPLTLNRPSSLLRGWRLFVFSKRSCFPPFSKKYILFQAPNSSVVTSRHIFGINVTPIDLSPDERKLSENCDKLQKCANLLNYSKQLTRALVKVASWHGHAMARQRGIHATV